MKSRKFQVILEITFDKPLDAGQLDQRILAAMRHDEMPTGMCVVHSRPVIETLDESHVKPDYADLLN